MLCQKILLTRFRLFVKIERMFENRKSVRYRTLAKVRIHGAFEGDHLLKDLSVTGCCVECSVYADIRPDTPYRLQIFPESAAKISDFELTVESRWLRAAGYSCDVGFSVVESPKGKGFQRYVDYLAWRSTREGGNSGDE